MVFGGKMPGGEIWESGFWMNDTGVTNESTANAQAEIVGAELNASDSSGALRIWLANLTGTGVTFEYVKCYAYTGGSTAAFIGTYTLPTPREGGATGGRMPNQVAAVVSLRTGFSGRRNRGRMYLPLNEVALGADGNIDSGLVDTVLTAWATAFTDLNAGDAGKVVVVSQVGDSFKPVTSVVMDSRPDIIRKRANKQTIDHVGTQAVTP